LDVDHSFTGNCRIFNTHVSCNQKVDARCSLIDNNVKINSKSSEIEGFFVSSYRLFQQMLQ